jgi:hypothetical protein
LNYEHVARTIEIDVKSGDCGAGRRRRRRGMKWAGKVIKEGEMCGRCCALLRTWHSWCSMCLQCDVRQREPMTGGNRRGGSVHGRKGGHQL